MTTRSEPRTRLKVMGRVPALRAARGARGRPVRTVRGGVFPVCLRCLGYCDLGLDHLSLSGGEGHPEKRWALCCSSPRDGPEVTGLKPGGCWEGGARRAALRVLTALDSEPVSKRTQCSGGNHPPPRVGKGKAQSSGLAGPGLAVPPWDLHPPGTGGPSEKGISSTVVLGFLTSAHQPGEGLTEAWHPQETPGHPWGRAPCRAPLGGAGQEDMS